MKLNINSISQFIAGAVFVGYLFWRSVIMSIVHDEAATSLFLHESTSDICFGAHCFGSANNHILNTLLSKFSVQVFGWKEWAMRLPNVLSFVIYYISAIGIASQVSKNSIWQWFIVLLFCANPYILDFFCLCRGYGIAMAFQSLSIYYLLKHLNSPSHKYSWLAFAAAAIAVYANLTWIAFYFALTCTYGFTMLQEIKKKKISISAFLISLSAPFAFGVLLVALCAKPIYYLRKNNEFKWGSNGWFDAQHNFAKNINYSDQYNVAIFIQILLLLLFVSAVLIYLKYRSSKSSEFLQVYILLLGSIVLLTIVQRNFLDIRYITERKATIYFPLVVGLLVTLLSVIENFRAKFIGAIKVVLAAIVVIKLFVQSTPNQTREWAYDVNSKAVFQKIISEGKTKKRVALNWLFMPSFSFYNKLAGNPLELFETRKCIIDSSFDFANLSVDDTTGVSQLILLSTDKMGTRWYGKKK